MLGSGGLGKTVLAAEMLRRALHEEQRSPIVAWHFCRHDDAATVKGKTGVVFCFINIEKYEIIDVSSSRLCLRGSYFFCAKELALVAGARPDRPPVARRPPAIPPLSM